jgi:1,4-alpha-glucan branching enzyme
MYAHPGKKLLFMGSEFGQWGEWDYPRSLDWHLCQYGPHQGVQALIRELNGLLRTQPTLHQIDFSWEGFQWIDFHDSQQSVVSFVRRSRAPDDDLVCVFNATPMPRPGYRIGVPGTASLICLLNTDDVRFGGSGSATTLRVYPENTPWQGQPCSAVLTLPPLGALILKPIAGA